VIRERGWEEVGGYVFNQGESDNAVMFIEVQEDPVIPLNSLVSFPDWNQGPGAVHVKLG
jgi:hypothetical protein